MDKSNYENHFARISSLKKRHLFWLLQVGGWILYSLVYPFWIGLRVDSFRMFILFSITLSIGFTITLVLWRINRRLRLKKLSFLTLSFFIVISIFFLAIIWITLDWAFSYSFWTPEQQEMLWMLSLSLPVFLRDFFWYSLILLQWSFLYLIINFWIDWNKQRMLAEKNKELFDQAKLIMLRYQLNPHFFFNSLNSINALMSEDVELAKEMMYKLSDFLRYSFLSNNKPMVNLEEEIQIIAKYFDIEKIRFEEKIKILYEIEPSTLYVKIPGLILHPIVENAVKYGMNTSPLPLIICITSKLTEKGLNLRISNTGKWDGKEYNMKNINTNKGIGLKNVYQRLENVFGSDFIFNIYSDDVRVEISMELNSAKIFQDEK